MNAPRKNSGISSISGRWLILFLVGGALLAVASVFFLARSPTPPEYRNSILAPTTRPICIAGIAARAVAGVADPGVFPSADPVPGSATPATNRPPLDFILLQHVTLA